MKSLACQLTGEVLFRELISPEHADHIEEEDKHKDCP